MIIKPRKEDFTQIGFFTGKLIVGIGITMIAPIIIGLLFKEINPALDFIIAAAICFIGGFSLMLICYSRAELNWMQGMIVVSLSWIIAAFFSAIPLFLSGHWLSFLDAYFEAISGYTTSGLTLAQDLEHLSFTYNFWRHFIMYIGGQGIVVVGLIFLLRGVASSFKMYVGEGRDERILPNLIETAKFIWTVSIVYLILGTAALATILFFSGMPLARAFFHGACIFMAAFDTGGFTPYSQNIMYYHNFTFEIVTIFIMVLGAINFRIHYVLWTGNKKEIWRNIDTVTLFISVTALFCLLAFDLSRNQVYTQVVTLLRRGFYQLISAHTGTGYANIYAQQFIQEWGQLALFIIILAMGIGGGICSTSGAIKTYRIGVLFKALLFDVKKLMMPQSAIIIQKIHHIKDAFLEIKHMQAAAMIVIFYICLYILGAIAGMVCGHPFLPALFESVSAAGNVGLSCGITSAAMPIFLKITYIMQMWIGRLEFMSIFALIGFIYSLIKGE